MSVKHTARETSRVGGKNPPCGLGLTSTVLHLKVTVNIFRFLHILLAELSRHTMIHCLKLTKVLKMEEISCKRRFP